MIKLNNIKYIITMYIILLIFIAIYFIKNLHLIYKSNNEYTHKNSDSLYAHFSKIDKINYLIFPKIIFANPIHIILNKGQSLYIPKKWWHWVKTTERTFAINYWFNNKKIHKPFIFTHTIKFDINLLDNELVHVWISKHNNNKGSYQQKFKDFYKSNLDDRYVLTLDNYEAGNNNAHIKNILNDYVTFPNNKKIIYDDNFEYNIWISSNKHNTGLHYDDEDGILTIIDGQKDIILYPPSDTQYLYPFDVSYKWKNTLPLNFRYNSFHNFGKINGICSGELLYITCNYDKRLLTNISKLYDKYNNHLIWGFKKTNDEYRWEIYNYTLNNDIKITSWDLYGKKYSIGDEEHYYYKMDYQPVKLPFWGYGKYKKNNVIYDESKIFVIDTYESFYKNYDEYMKKLYYNDIKADFKDIILKKYTCYEICVANKKENQIFVQYMGLTNEEFVNFLIENKYPQYIINYITKNIKLNKYNINNEITIVYDIKSKNILRSGFYGNL